MSPTRDVASGNRIYLPRVFLSYAHDDEEHVARVYEFARLLRVYGVQVVVDRDTDTHPGQNFASWAETQFRTCRFVAVIASPEYRRRAEEGVSDGDLGYGVQYEARRINEMLYDDYAEISRRLLRVVLPGGTVEDLPAFLGGRSTRYYDIRTLTRSDPALDRLLTVLTSKPSRVTMEAPVEQSVDKPVRTSPPRTTPPGAGMRSVRTDPAATDRAATDRAATDRAATVPAVPMPARASTPGARRRGPLAWLRDRPGRPAAATAAVAAVVVAVSLGMTLYVRRADPAAPVTLSLGYYGQPFAPGLLDRYERTHPGVTVVPHQVDWRQHEQDLDKAIAARAGANDVEIMDATYMPRFVQQDDRFVDLSRHGAMADEWTDAIRAGGTTRTGRLVGLPMDIGGMAICYRRSLFERAHLSSDEASVQRRFATWDGYFATGRQFTAAEVPRAHWFDRGANILNAVLGTAPDSKDDDPLSLDAPTDPRVKAAWDQVATAVEQGQSDAARPATWAQDAAHGQFATVACPAWVIGQLQDAMPAGSTGEWGMVAGPGGGSWSGTYVTVPASGRHLDRAADLAAWLAAPAQQRANFEALGAFPSATAMWDDPAVLDKRFAVTGNAAVGEIIAHSLRAASRSPLRLRSGLIAGAMINPIGDVENGRRSAASGWTSASHLIAQQAQL